MCDVCVCVCVCVRLYIHVPIIFDMNISRITYAWP